MTVLQAWEIYKTFRNTLYKLKFQERSDGYNAFEKDFAIINIYFGDATAMGNFCI